MLAERGNITLRNNWSKSGWVNSHEGGGFQGSVTVAAPFIIGTSPGFSDESDQNYRLTAGSIAVNAGTALHADTQPDNGLEMQYRKHQRFEARPMEGNQWDVGAYERSIIPRIMVWDISVPEPIKGRFYSYAPTANGGTGEYVWSIVGGEIPPGLFFDPATGRLSGKLARKGTWTFQLLVRDANDAPNTTGPINRTFTVKLYPGVN